MMKKKVLLRERKRHTARRVVTTPVVLTGYLPSPSWPGPGAGWGGGVTLPGYPPAGYPPRVCPMAFWEMLQSIMGYGYPHCGQTDWWKDRRVSKHYLPVVLRTRAIKRIHVWISLYDGSNEVRGVKRGFEVSFKFTTCTYESSTTDPCRWWWWSCSLCRCSCRRRTRSGFRWRRCRTSPRSVGRHEALGGSPSTRTSRAGCCPWSWLSPPRKPGTRWQYVKLVVIQENHGSTKAFSRKQLRRPRKV